MPVTLHPGVDRPTAELAKQIESLTRAHLEDVQRTAAEAVADSFELRLVASTRHEPAVMRYPRRRVRPRALVDRPTLTIQPVYDPYQN